MADLI